MKTGAGGAQLFFNFRILPKVVNQQIIRFFILILKGGNTGLLKRGYLQFLFAIYFIWFTFALPKKFFIRNHSLGV